jgi:competence protein ComEA
MRASAWSAVGVRLAAVVVALLVLGWIGRTTAAAGASPATALGADAAAPALPTVVAVDAGALPVTANANANANAALPPTASSAAAPAAHGRATAEAPVFLNAASVDELRRLPGVGPKRAEAILVLRQRLGRFHRVEDLLRVKGVGRAAVKKWRPLVRLDSPDAGVP